MVGVGALVVNGEEYTTDGVGSKEDETKLGVGVLVFVRNEI